METNLRANMNIKIGDVVRTKITLNDGTKKEDSVGIVEKICYVRGFDYDCKILQFHYVRLKLVNQGIMNTKLFNVKDLKVIRKSNR
jgi:hypothetical protein